MMSEASPSDVPPTPLDDTVLTPTSSAVWTADSGHRHADQLSRYLDTAAEMSAVQVALERAIALLSLNPGDSIVDIGCGNGTSIPNLSKAVGSTGSVIGVDHSEVLLEEARRRTASTDLKSNVRFELGDAQALPFPDDQFDAAHFSRVLIHLEDPDQALREAHRVVKPGGWVVAIEPDFVGMRLDHGDPEAARLLVAAHAATVKHPAMGLELYRRMADARFSDRRVSWVTELESLYDSESTPFYQKAADNCVESGWLDRKRADAAVDYLIAAGENDQFVSYSSLIIVAGRVSN